jgi:hypothetical protein
LFGEVSSEASVHLENGVMTATIHAPEETYHIEVIICFTVYAIRAVIAQSV